VHFNHRTRLPSQYIRNTYGWSAVALIQPFMIWWHRILRLFLKTFNLLPGVPGFIIYYMVLIVNPMGRILVRSKSCRNNFEIQCHPILNRCKVLKNTFKGGPEPVEEEINEILGSKREDRLSDPFFELVQNTSLVRFSLCNFCKPCRTCESSRRSARR